MTSDKFEAEENLIRSVLEPEEILEISLTDATDKSIHISLVLTPDEYIQAYVRPMNRIGYTLYPKESTTAKLVFHKGETFNYNLELIQAN